MSENLKLLVDVGDERDPELILLSAVIALFTSHPSTRDLGINAKARVASYINERFGEFVETAPAS